ncbi:MAG: hypothetical protein M1835_007050 [Candelina submexicana]|nr:MAG: hypothetical protein M1835_007050 [Candelina submexicana]
MDSRQSHRRTNQKRQPLGDATTRANNSQPRPAQRSHKLDMPSSPRLPHHESLKPNGNLAAPFISSSPMPTVENPRLSAIANDTKKGSNRDSQISTTSTNGSGKSRRKTHVGPWQLGKTLGKGATGRVRFARHSITGQLAAIKIVSKKDAGMVRATSLKVIDDKGGIGPDGERLMPFGIEREVVIMKLISHPNVISLYDVWENRGELYLVLEYVEGGELFDYVVRHGRLHEEEAVRCFRQIIAALSYCHRLNIYHRDLKPENILMDHRRNIKLADFGMSALQQTVQGLNTSCGSPHYASPEVIQGERYQGDKADIWSCGVVLYALLCGILPFDGPDIKSILVLVKTCRYQIPEWLSREARDLISKMLRPKPSERINMDAIWKHPLLKKYENQSPKNGRRGTANAWIGVPSPPLSIENCGMPVKSRAEVDRELLRNLRTLWHSENEEALVQKLLSSEPNLEKFFYCSLLKYREDHLENYVAPSLLHSASDYHHHKPATIRQSKSQTRINPRGHSRQRSQFSILSDDRPKSRAGYYQAPRTGETVESYDPYRSSRNPIIDPQVDHSKITVLRGSSTASRNRPSSYRSSIRHAALARVQALDSAHSPSSDACASSPLNLSPIQRSSSATRRYATRSSLTSSHFPSSPPVITSRSSKRKRGVSFSHLRKSSSAHVTLASRRDCDYPQTLHERYNQDRLDDDDVDGFVPQANKCLVPEPGSAVRSRKGVPPVIPRDIVVKKPRTPSHYWKEEARQVSSELEKFCDEAFNRSSIASSVRTAATDRANTYDSPISSVSKRNSGASSVGVQSGYAANENLVPGSRPLPALPRQLPESVTTQELAETRRRLLQRAAEGTTGVSQGRLDEIICTIDRLMQPNTASNASQENSRRIASAPDPQSQHDRGYLPVISEEGREPGIKLSRKMLDTVNHGYRSASQPTPVARPPTRRAYQHHERENRLTEHQHAVALATVAPLNVRKKSAQVSPTVQVLDESSLLEPAPDPRYPNANASRVYVSTNQPIHDLQDASENANRQISELDQVVNKRKGWFKRREATLYGKEPNFNGSRKDDEITLAPQPLDSVWAARGRKLSSSGGTGDDAKANSSEQKRASGSGKRGFFKIFSKRDADKSKSPDLALAVSDPEDNNSIRTSVAEDRALPDGREFDSLSSDAQLRTGQYNQNWLARFLHIKPASKLLCFCITKRQARREVAAILRDWKRYGMKDVSVDKDKNIVFGRVDQMNFLRIKEVAFIGEIMTVLEHGKRAQLSIARFTQQKGAASSFHKVVDTLETVLNSRGLLVTDRKRRMAMCKVLA